MNQQFKLLNEKRSTSQIILNYEKQFTQITERYSDGHNSRCAIGVLMSFLGWDGRVNFDTANNLLAVSDVLKHAGIEEDLLIELNDSGMSFDEIADYLSRYR
jgi:hypothetical protein